MNRYIKDGYEAVPNEAKILIWKQITTAFGTDGVSVKLFLMKQRY